MRIINEVSRRNLVGKTKVFSPTRYNKRLRYATMSVPEIDEDELLYNDMLVLSVQVGQYTDTIAFKGFMKRLIDTASKGFDHRVNRRLIVRILNEQIDLTDVYVRCNCPDMRYRFAYFATKYGYLYGEPENRPSNITNPHDQLGATCKHLCCVLSNKMWLVKSAPVINDFIHNHYEDILKQYKISEDEFVIDEKRYNAMIPTMVKKEIKRLPAELLGVTAKLYYPEELESQLNELLGKRGWYIKVDTDLDKPTSVSLSKDEDALDNEDDNIDNVYVFEVVPAGTRIRLRRVDDK